MQEIVSTEVIENRIFIIRGLRVMLDSDLARLYEVETKRINEAVKRNPYRFPCDFMLQLTIDEWENLKSHFATSSWGGRRKLPYAFTEHGVLMLSSVLNSEKAARVNIQIMRAFVKLRQIAIDYNNFPQRLSEIEKLLMLYMEKTDGKLEEHDQNFSQIIEVLNNLIETPREPKKIGFRVPEDKQ